ncbi:MAG: hypothetical protein HOP04_12870 [Methylophilaceae bacterium]|nr:hypothetical protein [Methylophilaceae bacterium]
MHHSIKSTSVLLSVLLLSACASVPNGPSLMALPGSNKNFDQFRYDDNYCRQYALEQIGGTTANQAADSSVAKSAVVGTALGAALGAAAGGGRGAGIGAATGLLIGSLIGVDKGNQSSSGAQGHYDNAYVQCMYAKGHKVPVSGHVLTEQPQNYSPAQSSPSNYPPPPPGYNQSR